MQPGRTPDLTPTLRGCEAEGWWVRGSVECRVRGSEGPWGPRVRGLGGPWVGGSVGPRVRGVRGSVGCRVRGPARGPEVLQNPSAHTRTSCHRSSSSPGPCSPQQPGGGWSRAKEHREKLGRAGHGVGVSKCPETRSDLLGGNPPSADSLPFIPAWKSSPGQPWPGWSGAVALHGATSEAVTAPCCGPRGPPGVPEQQRDVGTAVRRLRLLPLRRGSSAAHGALLLLGSHTPSPTVSPFSRLGMQLSCLPGGPGGCAVTWR